MIFDTLALTAIAAYATILLVGFVWESWLRGKSWAAVLVLTALTVLGFAAFG